MSEAIVSLLSGRFLKLRDLAMELGFSDADEWQFKMGSRPRGQQYAIMSGQSTYVAKLGGTARQADDAISVLINLFEREVYRRGNEGDRTSPFPSYTRKGPV